MDPILQGEEPHLAFPFSRSFGAGDLHLVASSLADLALSNALREGLS